MCGGINEALPFHPEFSWLIAPHGAPPHHFNFKWSLPTPPVLANKMLSGGDACAGKGMSADTCSLRRRSSGGDASFAQT